MNMNEIARPIRSEIDAAMPHILAAAEIVKRLRGLNRRSSRLIAGQEIGFALTNLYVICGILGFMFDEARVRRIVATLDAIDSMGEQQ
jgi:hypothetical protein